MTEIETLAFERLKLRIGELEQDIAFMEARMNKFVTSYEEREKEILKAYKSMTGETSP
jgi:hypothetical protein